MKQTISGSIIIAILFIGAPFVGGQTTPDRPWTDNAFSPDIAAVIRAAEEELQSEETKGTADGIFLFREIKRVIEADGRQHSTARDVIVVLTPRSVESFSSIESFWKPWLQDRHSIRARVITPDGMVHELDQDTITESPASEGHPAIFGDSIVLSAPLPSLTPGAIIEQEIKVSEKTAVFDEGTVSRVYLGGALPTRHTRIHIQASASIPLRIETQLLPDVETQRLEDAGQVYLTFEIGSLAPVDDFDPLMPKDVPQWPYIAFSTGESWAEVAAGFSRVVDAQIEIEAVEEITTETLRGSTTREEIAEQLLKRVHQDVRYTGVFFGNAAIVPRSPRETLQRGYGDCKDQAALLIAMFRSVGIEAYMALLNTGFGNDPNTDLPGFGAFDHAIVFVPGTPPLWIDPSDEFSRLGQLPTSSQGRLTLIAGPDTTNLIRTPESLSADNRSIENREVILAEEGPARIVETTHHWGAEESFMRGNYSQMNNVEVHERLEDYAKETYMARTIANLEYTDPQDWSQPFRIHLEAVDVQMAFTDEGEAFVGILLHPLVGPLSHIPAGERTDGLVLPWPFVTEWRYKIVLPPGFRPRALPENETMYLGPAFLTKEFSASQDAFMATIRLDTAKRRFTAEETKELLKGIEELENSEPLFLIFDQVGEEHLQAGRIREALAEFRRLATLHPDEAIHHTQIARALLAGGMGEAARQEAQSAVALEPTATAYRTLGWILQHDHVGRRFKKGFDLDAAVAAYRNALEIDPSDTVARGDLAILLEHDAQGIRYGAEADLSGAIAEFEVLLDESDPPDFLYNNLLIALMTSERFEEMKQRIGDPQDSPALFLVATAATDGPEPAVREATRMFPKAEARHPVLLEAGFQLAQLRRYPEAAALLNAAAQGAPNPAEVLGQAYMMSTARRHEEITYPEEDPVSVVKRLFIYSFLSIDQLPSLFTEANRKALLEDQEEFSQFQSEFQRNQASLEKEGISPDFVVDVTLALGQWEIDGEYSSGCRIRYQLPNVPGDFGGFAIVVVEDDEYRILADDGSLEKVGIVALQFADGGDLPTARTLLDWALEGLPASVDDELFGSSPLSRFWTKGAKADESQIRYAAATLMAADAQAGARAVPILQEGRKSASGDELVDFDVALTLAFVILERHEDTLQVVERLLEVHPESTSAFSLYSAALISLQHWGALRNAAEERLERIPDDAIALRVLIELAAKEGDFDRTEELDEKLVESGKVQEGDLNNRAWRAQFIDPFRVEALGEAQRSVSLTQGANSASLHTLACLLAEAGRTSDALAVINQSLEVAAKEELGPDDWYVFGRVAEQYGELEAAMAAYRRLEAPKPEEDSKQLTYYLAQKRLGALKATHTN